MPNIGFGARTALNQGHSYRLVTGPKARSELDEPKLRGWSRRRAALRPHRRGGHCGKRVHCGKRILDRFVGHCRAQKSSKHIDCGLCKWRAYEAPCNHARYNRRHHSTLPATKFVELYRRESFGSRTGACACACSLALHFVLVILQKRYKFYVTRNLTLIHGEHRSAGRDICTSKRDFGSNRLRSRGLNSLNSW